MIDEPRPYLKNVLCHFFDVAGECGAAQIKGVVMASCAGPV